MKSENQDSNYKFRTPPKNPGNRASRWVKLSATRVKRAIEILEDNLGKPCKPGPDREREPLQVLVMTVLSQNTTDNNSLAAYRNLLEEFSASDRKANSLQGDKTKNIDMVEIRVSRLADALPALEWKKLARTSRSRIEELISPAGLQKSKAKTIGNILTHLEKNSGSFKLNQLLEEKSTREKIKALTAIKGVGLKTAAVTLLESTGEDICPVDTHVHRVSGRVGFVPPEGSRNKTYRLLQKLIPPGKSYSLHHNLLSFGRSICTARSPDCENCWLSRICRYYRCQCQGEELEIKYII